ncbi:DUF2834 domain-containing protein [Cupriavidus sp. PET2-C1]
MPKSFQTGQEREMGTRTAYLILIVLGAVLPLYFLMPFLLENGLDVRLFLGELFANAIGRFFAMDVLVSGIVTIVFTLSESRRLAIRSGPLCLLGLLVGVSVALPLFLFVRHRHVASRRSAAPQPTAEAASSVASTR